MELGVAFAESGRDAEAIAALREAVRLQPTLPRAWLNLAALLDRNGDRGDLPEGFFVRPRHRRSCFHGFMASASLLPLL